LQAAVVMPAAMALGLLAHDLVPVVLGGRWAGAAPLTLIVAVRAMLMSLGVLPRAALLAGGRPWLIAAIGAYSVAAYAAGGALGFPGGRGGGGGGGGAAAAFLGPLTFWLARSDMGVTVRAWLQALLPAAGATVLVASGVLAARALVPERVLPVGPARLAL